MAWCIQRNRLHAFTQFSCRSVDRKDRDFVRELVRAQKPLSAGVDRSMPRLFAGAGDMLRHQRGARQPPILKLCRVDALAAAADGSDKQSLRIAQACGHATYTLSACRHHFSVMRNVSPCCR